MMDPEKEIFIIRPCVSPCVMCNQEELSYIHICYRCKEPYHVDCVKNVQTPCVQRCVSLCSGCYANSSIVYILYLMVRNCIGLVFGTEDRYTANSKMKETIEIKPYV